MKKIKMKKAGTVRYLELNLGNNGNQADLFTQLRPLTELEILRSLKRAATDKKLSGIFINTTGFSANRIYLWELRKALENCKAMGKKIVAYFDIADMDLYCLLSIADKIIMDEAGTLIFLGYSWGRFYMKDSLKKLGLGFRELRYLDYKSANETFSRTSISKPDREQYGAYLDDIFKLTKSTIIQARSLKDLSLKEKSFSENDFDKLLSDDILLSSKEASASLEAGGLVDALGREEAIMESIKAMEFLDTEEGKIHFHSTGNMNFSFFNQGQKTSNYKGNRAWGLRVPEIAVINAKGNTDLDRGMAARNINKIIRELGKKSRVKAMVIRIDSPGGSAVAADFVDAAIQEVKKRIPVVVSMGQVAASGGYWAAMNASHICACPYTLTGSIGVIGGWFFEKGCNKKLGFNFEALARGNHADLTAGIILPQRDLRKDEEARFRRCLLDLYGQFIKKAANGRNMKSEDLEPLSRGRVYSGLTSQALGLVDSLGGYLEALEVAIELANLPPGKKIRIREYPKLKFVEALAAKAFTSISSRFFPAASLIQPPQLWDDLIYRLSHNGEAMPILPLDFY